MTMVEAFSQVAAPLLLCVVFATPPVLLWLVWPKDAPWNTTSWKRARRMLELANVQPGELVYDLGAGDGRFMLVAAREFNAQAIGIEIDFLRCQLARLLIALNSQRHSVAVVHGDLFQQDLSNADVIMMFLSPRSMRRFEATFEGKLQPGVRIVSRRFELPGWKAMAYVEEDDIYLYILNEREAIT